MKVSQLALTGVMLAGWCSTLAAQQGGYAPQAPTPADNYAQPGMGYPAQSMQQGGGMPGPYQSYDQQAAMYGTPGPLSAGPMPMDGSGAPGCGAGGCGDGGCPNGCGPGAQCYDDGATHYAYGSAEVFYARRNNDVIRQATIIDTNTGLSAAGTSDTEFIYLPGIKAQAGYMFGCGLGVETDFWGQWAFVGRKTVPGSDNLAFPGDLGLASANFFDVDQIQETYSSHINNYEINMVLPYGSIQYLAGFRYVTVDERFDLSTASAISGTGDYQIITRNRLYGGQLGARGQWEIGRFIIDAEVKGGAFVNADHQDQQAVDTTGFPIRSASGGDKFAAFVGEVSTYLLLPIGTHFIGRLGGTGIWMEDLALAPNQLDFSDTATSGTGINSRGGIMIYGFNAGMEFRW